MSRPHWHQLGVQNGKARVKMWILTGCLYKSTKFIFWGKVCKYYHVNINLIMSWINQVTFLISEKFFQRMSCNTNTEKAGSKHELQKMMLHVNPLSLVYVTYKFHDLKMKEPNTSVIWLSSLGYKIPVLSQFSDPRISAKVDLVITTADFYIVKIFLIWK